MKSQRTGVFISYSHADKYWLDRLLVHLKPYVREGLGEWDDRVIERGGLWRDEIEKAMNTARVAVLMVSADFVASAFINDVELPNLIGAARKGEVILLPLYVGHAAAEKTGLHRYQGLNDIAHPLNDYREKSEADLMLREAARQISNALGQSATTKALVRFTPRTRIPGRLVAATIGLLDFWRTTEFRESIRKDIFASGVAHSIVGESLNLRERERSRDVRIEEAGVWIVHGPAGVGKSTLVSDMVRQSVDSFDLWLILPGGRITGETRDDTDANIANEILAFVDGLAPITARHKRLSAAGVAHALNSRRVLIIIEDAHHGGSTRDVLTRVRRYLDSHHRWNEKVRIITTTRETPEDLIGLSSRDVRFQTLTPLPQREAQNLFYALCTDNGVSQAELVRHGDELGASFATEGIRTPLFVSICALIACRARDNVALGRILEMSTSEVLDTFFDILLKRSGAEEGEQGSLLETYRRLALAMWPEWENCRTEAVVETLRSMNSTASGDELLGFFERGGFLFRPWYQSTRMHFPHHAIADYLASSAMRRSLDFTKLRNDDTAGRFEGLVPFLADMLDDHGFSTVVAASLPAALAIVRYRTERGRPVTVKPLQGAMKRWATALQPDGSQSPEAWQAVRDLLRERVSDAWLQQLALDIERDGHVTSHAIEALAALDHPASRDLLGRWLGSDSHLAAFESAAGYESVANWLTNVAASYPSRAAHSAFRLLLKQPNPASRSAVERILADHAEDLDANDIRALWAAGPATLRAVGEALKESSVHAKRRVSQSVVSAIGLALIPCGVYDVPENGKMVRVSISRPLLVPLAAEVINGSFRERASYADALQRKLPKQKTIMTKYQALVALNYFGLPSPGIRFYAPGDDIPEIFWEPPGKNPNLYVLPDKSTTTVAAYKPRAEAPVIKRVAFRTIDQL